MNSEMSLPQENTGSKVASTYLTPQQLYQHDPFLKLLKDKWRLNITWFIIGSALLLVGIYFGLQTLAHVPFTPKSNLLRLINIFSSILFYGIYFHLPDSIANLFNSMIDNQVILIDEPLSNQTDSASSQNTHSGKFIAWIKRVVDKPLPNQISSTPPIKIFWGKFSNWINTPLWLALSLPFIIAYPLFRLLGPYISSMPLPLWLRIIGETIDFSIGYVGVLSIVRISVALLFLYRFLNSFTVRINPLHPDGSGGLGALRQVLWNSAGIMLGIACAFFVDSIISSRAVDIALLMTAYIVLIPSLLIGWLILPHHMMLKARNEVLQPLTDEYQKIIKEKESLANDSTEKITARTERLVALTQRYDLCRNIFPVWPLEVVQMRQVLIAFILPLLIGLISVIPSLINFFTQKP